MHNALYVDKEYGDEDVMWNVDPKIQLNEFLQLTTTSSAPQA